MHVKLPQLPSQEILDDLCSRFILNAPPDDLQSFERLLFVVEQAHWFYEDTVRERQPGLRSYSLREFTVLLFQRCPALQPYTAQVHSIYDSFNAYRVKVPVTGAVVLDASLQWVLLVKGWKANASWGFPKGKKSRDEDDSTCASREVEEETGLNIAPLLKPEDYLESSAMDRRCRLYMVAGVDKDTTRMQPRTKKEISSIAWHALGDLVGAKGDGTPPSVATRTSSGVRLYGVQPFVRRIVAWAAGRHTAATRALAAKQPAVPGQVITVWSCKGEQGEGAVPGQAHGLGLGLLRAAGPRPGTGSSISHSPEVQEQQSNSISLARPLPGAETSLLGSLGALEEPAPGRRPAVLLGRSAALTQYLPGHNLERQEQGYSENRQRQQLHAPAPLPPCPPTLDALGRPLFMSLRNFHFDVPQIMRALDGKS